MPRANKSNEPSHTISIGYLFKLNYKMENYSISTFQIFCACPSKIVVALIYQRQTKPNNYLVNNCPAKFPIRPDRISSGYGVRWSVLSGTVSGGHSTTAAGLSSLCRTSSLPRDHLVSPRLFVIDLDIFRCISIFHRQTIIHKDRRSRFKKLL